MGKPGLGIFTARRKSQGNAFDQVDVTASPSPDTAASAHADPGGFRLLSRTEVDKANERRKTQEKESKSSKFPRFSSFGAAAHKGRNHSFDDESPGSSKRDSKSSSGTQFSTSRPYTNGQHGSTSTLPSSTDTSSDDNLFANLPRPQIPQNNSSSSSYSIKSMRKTLPSVPKPSSGVSYQDQLPSDSNTRHRALTTSSYASTAVPPKLNDDLDFGGSSFGDDMFSGLNRKSPELPRDVAGRSLLSEKRTFQAEPIKIHPHLQVEAPLKSWDSHGSADNLMSPPRSDDDSPPPPPPLHKYNPYAPVASESPTLHSSATFQDADAQHVRKSFMERKTYRESSPEPQPISISSSANSYETPLSSRSASSRTNNTTPRAAFPPKAPVYPDTDEDDLFTPVKVTPRPQPRPTPSPTAPTITEYNPAPTPAPVSAPTRAPSATSAGNANGRVMTQAEFREYQKRQMSKPSADESSDEEDYEDEEEAIKKREEEEIMRRKNQQMHFAREAMRRSTTAPGNPGGSGSVADGFSMGFPSETSIKADEWEDEDIPLGILAQHGFPSQARSRFPTQPANPTPSYFPERPASAGVMSYRASQANLPAFARNLPADPYIGGGLVRPLNRESMGFNSFGQGPASIAGDSVASGMGMGSPLVYQDAGMSQPSLVDQIQMRDMTKQKYMGGASAKKPQGGPFTGMLGQQMNSSGQPQNPMRVSPMPNNPMMNMMGGQMPMMGMGMNMNPMGYPQDQYSQMQQFQQMQQMIAMQQMQLQQMQQMQQDPRMSTSSPSNGFQGNMMGNGSFLGVPGQQNRAMSFMSSNGNQQQRSMSGFAGAGYTPSIAPSERSNIGLSARYRPVVNHSDSISNGTSMTLQATGGANQGKPAVIKGILKKGSPQPNAHDEEEDWGKMAARKTTSAKGKENEGSGLEELTRGLRL
ncbi:uncharacterized protein K460DRAFT_285287 [Cucurbitaria berberidis CBS 394.84]|uniref:Med15 multi-domain protein n=1 Tax=Cucurbitaria berberidis CBS 394.84 TaxID=1168544 RepID=A0A9P4GII9_9PLEO|nr:uncharacterized protein K460DRAFT_285287 [Cucurbitaria berberidis CBS 394.84]KAF1845816.1 hypothetical protein K460DRAFT_285287 [Cucurbitaria berberidis CBS 394.84]